MADELAGQVRALHMAVGKRNVRGSLEPEDVPAAPVRTTREFEMRFEPGSWRGEILPRAARLFGTSHVSGAAAWFLRRVNMSATAPLIWISFTQLYLDYQLTWGNAGPSGSMGNGWIKPRANILTLSTSAFDKE